MIVISGITSSVGIRLALFLVSKGIQVIGFSRNISSVKKILNHPLIQLYSADLNDEVLMRSICLHAEVIVHLAALSAPWGKYDDFFRINVKGTEFIIKAASQLQLKRFIHISSSSIYFIYKDRCNITETEPLPRKCVNAYATTKKIAEERVNLAFLKGLPTIILRPRAIFGPNDKVLFPRILQACQEKGIPTFKKKTPLIDVTYVDNLVYAIYLAINASSSCIGQTYNITNGEPIFFNDLLEKVFYQLSIPLKKRIISYSLAYNTAWITELISFFTKKEPLFTRYSIGLLTYSQTLSINKARKELKYKPVISLQEGIKKYVQWLQAQKNLSYRLLPR